VLMASGLYESDYTYDDLVDMRFVKAEQAK